MSCSLSSNLVGVGGIRPKRCSSTAFLMLFTLLRMNFTGSSGVQVWAKKGRHIPQRWNRHLSKIKMGEKWPKILQICASLAPDGVGTQYWQYFLWPRHFKENTLARKKFKTYLADDVCGLVTTQTLSGFEGNDFDCELVAISGQKGFLHFADPDSKSAGFSLGVLWVFINSLFNTLVSVPSHELIIGYKTNQS